MLYFTPRSGRTLTSGWKSGVHSSLGALFPFGTCFTLLITPISYRRTTTFSLFLVRWPSYGLQNGVSARLYTSLRGTARFSIQRSSFTVSDHPPLPGWNGTEEP